MKKLLVYLTLLSGTLTLWSQEYYWQQHVDYKMEIDMDIKKYQFDGKQELVYTNNSPDTLKKVYYHLYFNAFQPGSEMDIRSRTIKDPDKRVGDRISKLSPKEIGFIKVNQLSQDGKPLNYEVVGTILEVKLNNPIPPKSETTFSMDFKGQVPQQIRRSGRNSSEGIALSMTQWYPKLAEYDIEGWHADPYIGREFHGVWGNFDVHIKLDKNYTIAGSGVLQNPEKIGHGYAKIDANTKLSKKLDWHFVAENVHDFTWAADDNYIHDRIKVKEGQELHFFYKNDPNIIDNWKKLQPITQQLLAYYEAHIGPYPYPQYSVIQGGDGGMEYAMCTLITGGRKMGSLVGVTAHEMAHAWFQHLLATNESKYEWMDEGFTTYISNLAENEVMQKNKALPNQRSYDTYRWLANSGIEQPQTTHADRYALNAAYGASAYAKGAVFLDQLGYLVGEDVLQQIIKTYCQQWQFKHPNPNDFKRVAEKVSGMELDWYLTDWTQTTNSIDYGVKKVTENGKNKSTVTLERIGLMPMPLEIKVTFYDTKVVTYHIPLQMMRKIKKQDENTIILKDWAWAYPEYNFEIESPKKKIKSIEIITDHLADVNEINNKLNVR